MQFDPLKRIDVQWAERARFEGLASKEQVHRVYFVLDENYDFARLYDAWTKVKVEKAVVLGKSVLYVSPTTRHFVDVVVPAGILTVLDMERLAREMVKGFRAGGVSVTSHCVV